MPAAPPARFRYSVVVPVLNEEAVLPALLERMDWLLSQFDGAAEAIFVDDGSDDATAAMLERHAERDSRYRLVKLSRNFGHQAAITAGMDLAAGEAVIVMDADLQDPPEVALQLAAKWQEGFQVVYAQRTVREGEGPFKRWSAHLFYALLQRVASVQVQPNVGDFRLVDRRVLRAFKSMPERDRFVRGMFGWLGFKQAVVPFARRGDQISAAEDDPPGGAWAGQLLGRTAPAGAVARPLCLRRGACLWGLCDRRRSCRRP